MQKVLSASQTKALDAYTIAHEPVASIDLMERACRSFVTWFGEKFDSFKKVGIVCGTGNNGGDGLGIARVLYDRNYAVKVWVVKGGGSETDDFKANLKRLPSKIPSYEITSEADRGLFHGCDIVIDAIFGTGLSRPAEGIYAQAINCINNTDAIKVAVDVPSGLMTDAHSAGVIVKADYTVTFQLPKLAFLLPENADYVGEWITVNIGLHRQHLDEMITRYHMLERGDIMKFKKHRSKFSHKGTFGKALLIAGGLGKMGAAVLSARSTMRSGVGLLTVHVPGCGYNILQTSVPEAMVSIDRSDNQFSEVPSLAGFDAIGVGPGIGTDDVTVKALRDLLTAATYPVVIDADALNILASHRELLHLIPKGSILTPHPKEFERLAGTVKNDYERLDLLKNFAHQTNTYVILKGAYTAIASPGGDIYFNSTGNAGMATGGSGDVLTGILTGLLAQGYEPVQVAKLGVYLHGLAGDLAAKVESQEGLIASDLVAFTAKAFLELKN